MVFGTELGPDDVPLRPAHEVTGAMWLNAHRTLCRLAELGERAGVTFCLENLNTVVDHPGAPFARPQDTLALVEAVNRPGLRMMLDLYHAQIGEGNLIAVALKEMGYRGTVGLEAYASGEDEVALERFSSAFGAGATQPLGGKTELFPV